MESDHAVDIASVYAKLKEKADSCLEFSMLLPINQRRKDYAICGKRLQ